MLLCTCPCCSCWSSVDVKSDDFYSILALFVTDVLPQCCCNNSFYCKQYLCYLRSSVAKMFLHSSSATIAFLPRLQIQCCQRPVNQSGDLQNAKIAVCQIILHCSTNFYSKFVTISKWGSFVVWNYESMRENFIFPPEFFSCLPPPPLVSWLVYKGVLCYLPVRTMIYSFT